MSSKAAIPLVECGVTYRRRDAHDWATVGEGAGKPLGGWQNSGSDRFLIARLSTPTTDLGILSL